MTKQLTKAKAEACLAAVQEQFAEYLGEGADPPKLYEPGFHSSGWTIGWEGGPHEWSMLAFNGGFDEEMYHLLLDAAREAGKQGEEAQRFARGGAQKKPHAKPAGVFIEPVNHWCLGLYPED